MARLLMVTSSYRKNSNSNALGAAVAAGAREKGHEVTIVDIARLTIKACRGCDHCLKPGGKGCVIKDDMAPLYPLVVQTDILIYVSPIYWFNLCGQLKQFIDRCYAVAINPDGSQPGIFSRKKLGAVLVYGDADPFASGCVNAVRSFQDICTYTGAAWSGAVYGSAHGSGEAAADTALLELAKAYGRNL